MPGQYKETKVLLAQPGGGSKEEQLSSKHPRR